MKPFIRYLEEAIVQAELREDSNMPVANDSTSPVGGTSKTTEASIYGDTPKAAKKNKQEWDTVARGERNFYNKYFPNGKPGPEVKRSEKAARQIAKKFEKFGENQSDELDEAVGMMFRCPSALKTFHKNEDIAQQIAKATGGRVKMGMYGQWITFTYPTVDAMMAAAKKIKQKYPDAKLTKTAGNRMTVGESKENIWVLNELDNGPKGKEHSDNLNYSSKRNMTGTYVSKDDLAKRREHEAHATASRKRERDAERRERNARKNVVPYLAKIGEPMVADWNLDGGYDGVRDGIIDMANDEGIEWTTKDIDRVMKIWGVEPEPKEEIPTFSSDKPTTPLEQKAQDAMWRVWNAIAPDLQATYGSSEEKFYDAFENPYNIAEVCVDANRLVTNGDLSDEEEREILDTLNDGTLARLCSRFGF